MATAKIILHDSPSRQRKDGAYPVVLRVTHKGKRKYFSLGRYCLPEQWHEDKQEFRKNYPDHAMQNRILGKFRRDAEDVIYDFEKQGREFSFLRFEMLYKKTSTDTLTNFMQAHIERLEAQGRHGTASPCKTAMNLIHEYTGKANVPFVDIDYSFLVDFETWLRTERGITGNSISVYLRSLRSVFNKAIKAKVVHPNLFPFNDYNISELKTETRKRDIDERHIRAIEALELVEGTSEQFAKDVFLFSYYTLGMNFADIAELKPANIVDGHIHYRRRKTKTQFEIKVTPKIQAIVDRYMTTRKPYIFPIYDDSIHKTPKQRRDRRKTALRGVNRGLKKIAKAIELDEGITLTTYVARYTVGKILQEKGATRDEIQQMYGHKSQTVTDQYVRRERSKRIDDISEEL